MLVYIPLILLLSILVGGCASEPTPEEKFAKFIIEAVVDKETGEPIQDAVMRVDYMNEELEDLIFEDYTQGELVIEVPLIEKVEIYVNAPGYVEWVIGFRTNSPKVLMTPVEMEVDREREQGGMLKIQ